MSGIRGVWDRFVQAVGQWATRRTEGGGPSPPESRPATPPDKFVSAKPPPEVFSGKFVGPSLLARYAEPREPDAQMVGEFESYARNTGAPDGTAVSPDSTSRWIAEFVVRHFRVGADENAASHVIDAYRYGIEQYLVMRQGFAQRDRQAHDAVRSALEGIPDWVFASEGTLSIEILQRIEEGIDAFLGRERVEWLERIEPASHLEGKRSRWLNLHIANYAVFRLHPQTYEEAMAMAEQIVQVGDALVAELQALGMTHTGYARAIVASAVRTGISLGRTEPFDEEQARALLREAIDRRFWELEVEGPQQRRMMRLSLDHGDVKATTAFDQLQAVRRRMAARNKDPQGGGSSGAAPAGGATSSRGGTASPAPSGTGESHVRGFAGMTVVADDPLSVAVDPDDTADVMDTGAQVLLMGAEAFTVPPAAVAPAEASLMVW